MLISCLLNGGIAFDGTITLGNLATIVSVLLVFGMRWGEGKTKLKDVENFIDAYNKGAEARAEKIAEIRSSCEATSLSLDNLTRNTANGFAEIERRLNDEVCRRLEKLEARFDRLPSTERRSFTERRERNGE